MQGRGKREFPEKKLADQRHRLTRFPHEKNPGVAPLGIEPGSPRWEASSLTAQLPRPLEHNVRILSELVGGVATGRGLWGGRVGEAGRVTQQTVYGSTVALETPRTWVYEAAPGIALTFLKGTFPRRIGLLNAKPCQNCFIQEKKRSGRYSQIWTPLNIEVFRADESGRDPREDPPTNGIVRHYSHMRKSGVTRPGMEPGSPRWEARRLTAQSPWPQDDTMSSYAAPECLVDSRVITDSKRHDLRRNQPETRWNGHFHTNGWRNIDEDSQEDLIPVGKWSPGKPSKERPQRRYRCPCDVSLSPPSGNDDVVTWWNIRYACPGEGMSSELSIEQLRNARMGKTGDPRENRPTSGITRHDSHVQKSGSDPAGNRTGFALRLVHPIRPHNIEVSSTDESVMGRIWSNGQEQACPEKTRQPMTTFLASENPDDLTRCQTQFALVGYE
ncbi:hypothetical protein PR048_023168 [Dryococelus australis]|uniref:Uncharacterized protein n=1 Tax=Dryococelus australis TaxID=614101 RepID=A0ABQ9GTC3_9NEOP|nr:hypothetical protein PR048_023168 [Dryococelus australis]